MGLTQIAPELVGLPRLAMSGGKGWLQTLISQIGEEVGGPITMMVKAVLIRYSHRWMTYSNK